MAPGKPVQFFLAYAVSALDTIFVNAEPNPPVWPSTVKVFGPEDGAATIASAVNAAFRKNGGHEPPDHGQFSDERFAFLFKPGEYAVDVPVGYYTQILGLGQLPTEVVFTSVKGVFCDEGSYSFNPGALNTFWRGAENFESRATYNWFGEYRGMLWAASQAAPLRRLIVSGNLLLYQYTGGDAAGLASGGFMANLQVAGEIYSGSQQQFLTRNSEIQSWSNGVWNMVFVGTKGAPRSHCGLRQPYVTVEATPIIAEKPFISIDIIGKYLLNIPQVRTNHVGADFGNMRQIDFSNVYVATAADDAGTINSKLHLGLHLILSPGIYNLNATLLLNTENQVLLGLGLATLVAVNGQPAIRIGNVDGVRVSGVLLEAGSKPTEALLQWGTGSYPGNVHNPGFLHDVFARVGGPAQPAQPQAKAMLQINSGYVIGDNLWLWRADHTASGLVKGGDNPCEVAMVVEGDDVTMYGLAAEHTLTDLVQWNGDRGSTYFFQSELPYDVTQAYGAAGYAGYRVKSTVQQHLSYGAAVYHYFRDFPVVVESGIVAPSHLEDSFVSPVNVYLNGLGIMHHVLNSKGEATFENPSKKGEAVPKYYCSGTSPSTPAPSPFRGHPAAPAPLNPAPMPTPLHTSPPTLAPATPPQSGTCRIGQSVQCPGQATMCAGLQCCPDESTCPSAPKNFKGCPVPKRTDCTGDGLQFATLILF